MKYTCEIEMPITENGLTTYNFVTILFVPASPLSSPLSPTEITT